MSPITGVSGGILIILIKARYHNDLQVIFKQFHEKFVMEENIRLVLQLATFF